MFYLALSALFEYLCHGSTANKNLIILTYNDGPRTERVMEPMDIILTSDSLHFIVNYIIHSKCSE